MARYLELAAAVTVGAVAAILLCAWLLVGHGDADAADRASARKEGYSQGWGDAQASLSEPRDDAGYMPLYLQTDPQWADEGYSDGTIGTYGCGLTACAMATTYLTGDRVTPGYLADRVGESCLTDRVNDMGKFSKWMVQTYRSTSTPVEAGETQWALADALPFLDRGYVLMAGLSGRLGERSYGGHIVLIWGKTEDGEYLVRDPASGKNSEHLFALEELKRADWGAFRPVRAKEV